MEELFETYRHIEKELSTTIAINHGQVLRITVADLMKKYKANYDNDEYRKAFETILRGFYLTEDEFCAVLKELELKKGIAP